jgi:uncharacterized membrane protein YqgA involved in biofilm formation
VFPGIGTLINVVAIIVGSILGKFGGNRIPERTRILVTEILGAITLISAAASLRSLWDQELIEVTPQGSPILIVLTSLIIGALIGSALNLEVRLISLGEYLKRKLGSSNGTFVEGFVAASLVFAIGPLAILGSISDGMKTGIDQLLLKSTLDFFAAIAFAAALGWGVLFSFLPVGIYQAIWTALGFGLGNVLNDAQVSAMTSVGGVLLIGIGLRLLNLRNIAVANILPALLIAPLLTQVITRI